MEAEAKKALPIGEDDFRTVIEEDYYYIDKTLLIKDFLTYKNKVALITRPRRFGKTLNMTMLRDFLDITGDSQKIFEGLKIMETRYADRINSVPVVYLSLKNCIGKTVEDLETSFAEEMYREYKKYGKQLANVDKKDSDYSRFFKVFNILEEEKEGEDRNKHIQKNLIFIQHSLSYLIEALYTYYNVRPIVLIDEYDNPIIEAHLKGFREEFTSFFSTFLTTALKGNPHVAQALLTGIQRVAKESIFSKLNNVVVYNVLDEGYAEYFGLIEAETRTLLDFSGLELNDKVKQYYDGYSFAGIEIYNPWSLLNYAQKKKMRNYWIKTSTNVLVKESVLAANPDFHRAFEKLIKDEKVSVGMNLEASFAELPRTDTLWGLLVNAGYLTVIDEDYELNRFTVRIPNREIVTEFKEIVSEYTKLSSQMLQEMLVALMNVDMDEFLNIYQELVLTSTSYHDAKENAYHMLMLGMVMQLRDLYEVTSNIEAGEGRSDIRLKSKSASRPHIILEFKQGEDVARLKHEALEQIEEKQYYAGLEGNVLCVGIAHYKKKCELVHEMRLL